MSSPTQQISFAIGDDPLSSPDNARSREQTVFFRSHHKRRGHTFLHFVSVNIFVSPDLLSDYLFFPVWHLLLSADPCILILAYTHIVTELVIELVIECYRIWNTKIDFSSLLIRIYNSFREMTKNLRCDAEEGNIERKHSAIPHDIIIINRR